MATLTWAAARDKVRGDLWRPGTSGIPEDVCDRALHASLLEVEQARRFVWLENVRQTVALVTAAAEFDVTDFRSLASVSPVGSDGSLDDALSLLSLGRVRILASDGPATGRPSNYAFTGAKVYLDVTAAAGSKFELIGFACTPDDLATAVAGGSTNVTLQLHQGIVIAGACAEVAGTFLKNEAEEQRQRRAFERRLERLCDREDEARSDNYGGNVVPDTAYQDMAGS